MTGTPPGGHHPKSAGTAARDEAGAGGSVDGNADGSVDGSADGSAGALRPLPAAAAALATGFGVMAAELTAVRLLAPHFGDSAYVWTNVIGVILAAMAIGAMLGGRLSSRPNAAAWPFWLLLAGAALLVVAPLTAGWLGDAMLPDDLPLDAAMPALIRGSLVATALVFAPPLLLLAAVSPLLIVRLARVTGLGRAAGDIAAAGTIGSLCGTFAATHWLVPSFGCRLALAIAGGVLLLAALVVAPRRRSLGASAAVLLLLVGGAAWNTGPLRPPAPGVELLAERETPYQFLQVLRDQQDGRARTTLVINEGLDSFHSLALEGSALTGGAYYDWHAVAPLFAGDGELPPDARVLSVGDAAGTLRAIYGAVHPGVPVDAVDIDPETMALGDEFFAVDGAPKATGDRYALDGRLFLERAERRWHTIHVDAYAHQVYVPAHLASVEFFAAARARLQDGGVLACNVGALDLEDRVLQAIGATAAQVFGREHVQVLLIPQSRNALLLARRDRVLQPASLAGFEAPATLRPADRDALRGILAVAKDPASWHGIDAEGPVLVDDRPVLDELLFDSYVERRDPRAVVTCDGTRASDVAELRAHEALGARDWQGVLSSVAASRSETALLRQFAGDARWYQRHLHSAELEYRAGAQLEASDDLRAALRGRLEAVRAQLEPIEAAEAAANRNGWLAWAVVGLGALLAFVTSRI